MDNLDKVLSDIREWCDENGLSESKEVRVRLTGSVELCRRGDMKLLQDFILVKRLLAVCDDNYNKCVYELPKSKPEYESDVLSLGYADDELDISRLVVIETKDEETAEKIKIQLEAQYQIIDIIQRTQNELDPTWVADWNDSSQSKAYICLSDFKVSWSHSTCRNFTIGKMVSSTKVMENIINGRLITAELMNQWQGE